MYSLSKENVVWTQELHNMITLAENYTFPQIIKVAIGHYGNSEWNTLDMGQIIRIHEVREQERILAKDKLGHEYSIPVDYHYPVELVRKKKGMQEQIDDQQLIKDIIGNGLPQTIRLQQQVKLYFYQDPKANSDVDELVLTKKYNEHYIIGNLIYNDIMDTNIIIIPMYLNIEVTIAEGFSNEPKEKWKQLMDNFNRCAADIRFNFVKGLKEITKYSEYSMKTMKESVKNQSRQSIYEHIKPQILCTSPNKNPFYFDLKEVEIERKCYAGFRINETSMPLRRKAVIVGRSKCTEDIPKLPPIPKIKNENTLTLTNFTSISIKSDSNSSLSPLIPISPLFPNNLSKLTIFEVSECLRKLNLEQYVKTFREHQIDGLLFLNLNENLLINDFNFKEIEAKRLMLFIHGWRPKY